MRYGMSAVRLAAVCTVLISNLAWAGANQMPNGHIVLLTDYGTDSVYVGILKGAIYTKFPGARIDSITNAVPPFDIVTGAYLLREAAPEYPRGTVFLCIVDPTVGTERKPIAIETVTGHYFVAPDNGLASLIVEKFGLKEIRECSNKNLWRSGTTSTVFHGRDIFGPVAAALASGVPFADVGTELDGLVKLDAPQSTVENGVASGVVLRSDPYGNLVTNVTMGDLESIGIKMDDAIEVTLGASTYAAPWKLTYALVPEGERLVVVQSSGFVECAINKGSLAEALNEKEGAKVSFTKAQP